MPTPPRLAPAGIWTRLRLGAEVVRARWLTDRLIRRGDLAGLVPLALARPPLRRPWRPSLIGGAAHRLVRSMLPGERGEDRVRCIHRAAVMQHLLLRQGQPAALVIGVKPGSGSARAHAWVELGGEVVGPPPGRMGHRELTRYE